MHLALLLNLNDASLRTACQSAHCGRSWMSWQWSSFGLLYSQTRGSDQSSRTTFHRSRFLFQSLHGSSHFPCCLRLCRSTMLLPVILDCDRLAWDLEHLATIVVEVVDPMDSDRLVRPLSVPDCDTRAFIALVVVFRWVKKNLHLPECLIHFYVAFEGYFLYINFAMQGIQCADHPRFRAC